MKNHDYQIYKTVDGDHELVINTSSYSKAQAAVHKLQDEGMSACEIYSKTFGKGWAPASAHLFTK